MSVASSKPAPIDRRCWLTDSKPRNPQSACRRQNQLYQRKPNRTEGVSRDTFSQIAKLKVALARSESELDRMRAEVGKVAIETLKEIVGTTTHLFGEKVYVYESRDPEFPEDSTVVFSATTVLDVHQIMQAQSDWVRTVARVAPKSSGSISLLVYPQ